MLESERHMYLVMEYCAGGHLEDYISPTRPMSEAAARCGGVIIVVVICSHVITIIYAYLSL